MDVDNLLYSITYKTRVSLRINSNFYEIIFRIIFYAWNLRFLDLLNGNENQSIEKKIHPLLGIHRRIFINPQYAELKFQRRITLIEFEICNRVLNKFVFRHKRWKFSSAHLAKGLFSLIRYSLYNVL